MTLLDPTQAPIQFHEFLLRPWQPQDRQEIATIVRMALTEHGLPWQPESVDRDVVEVEQHYHACGGELWVIEHPEQLGCAKGERLVGSGGFYPIQRHPGAVELRKMYLRPEMRGRGLGRFLLQTLEQLIRERGFEAIWIETSSRFPAAIHLYQRCGYQPPADPRRELTTQRCDQVLVKYLRPQPTDCGSNP